MQWVKRSARFRFLLFFTINILALILLVIIEPYLDGLSLFVFLTATIFVALFCGINFGILTAIIATLEHDYFFQNPRYKFGISTLKDAFQLGLFFCVAVIISWIGSSLRKAYFEAQEAKEKFQNESNDRASLLAIVSHDLKNHVQAIKLNGELAQLQLGGLQNKYLEVLKPLERIQWSADRMENLIVSLLELEKIRKGRLELDLKPEKPAQLVREVTKSLETIACQKSVKMEIGEMESLPSIMCDRERVLEVLANIIGNAIKYSNQNGLISIQGVVVEDQVQFCIQDSGPGIQKDEIPHVFETYWRGKGTSKPGTGLGLSISKGIVKAHGGNIWVESQWGTGSKFYFTIPKTQAELVQVEKMSA